MQKNPANIQYNQQLSIEVIMLQSARFVMILAGLWKFPTEKTTRNTAYNIYSAVIRSTILCFVVGMALGLFLHDEHYPRERVKAQVSYVIQDSIIAYEIFVAFSPQVQKLICEVDEFSKIIGNAGKPEREIYKRYSLKALKTNILLAVIVVSLTCTFYIANFKTFIIDWNDGMTEDQMPQVRPSQFVLWPMFPKHYYINYMYQTHCLLAITFGTIAAICLFATLIIYCTAQLDILCYNLKNIEIKLRKFSEEEIYSRVCECISFHQKIIRFVKTLDKVMSKFLFLDLFTHSLQTAIISCALITTEADSMTAIHLQYLFMIGAEILIFYWNANEIYIHSIAVSDAIYNGKWYTHGKNVGKLYLIMIQYAIHRPMQLHAGGLFPLSTELIVKVVKAVYTLTTLVNKF